MDASFIAECLHLCKAIQRECHDTGPFHEAFFGRCPIPSSMIRFMHTYYTKTTFNCVNLRPRTVHEGDGLFVAKELWLHCKTRSISNIRAASSDIAPSAATSSSCSKTSGTRDRRTGTALRACPTFSFSSQVFDRSMDSQYQPRSALTCRIA